MEPASTAPPADSERGGEIKVQRLELPKGGGAISGIGETFTPHEFSGTAGLTLPVPATPCRGFEPSLQIAYQSGGGNSPFGLGWSLSLPSITRRTARGTPRYNDEDVFLLSGSVLVPALNQDGTPVVDQRVLGTETYAVAHYRARNESAFARIERFTARGSAADVFWVVTDGQNVTSVYGKSPAARTYDPDDGERVFEWNLEEAYDARGNHRLYDYQKENDDGVPDVVSERNRDHETRGYLTGVRYGNERPVTDGALVTGASDTHPEEVTWRFEIVFDYGAYDIAPANPRPYTIPAGGTWSCRPDAYSDYAAGFEIRTHRLCHNVLLFHRFAEFGLDPVLVRALRLTHDESPLLSLLTKAEVIGYQYQAGTSPPYATSSLPPLEFEYTPFELETAQDRPGRYERFTGPDDEPLTRVSGPPLLQLLDLYGAGVPGILYADGETVRYREALEVSGSTVRYGAPRDVAFPAERNLAGTTATLTDVTGDGRLDVLVSRPEQAGYYGAGPRGDGAWQAFRPFAGFPSDYHEPGLDQADLTGDGLGDLVSIDERRVRLYPSAGAKGYDAPLTRPREHDLPASGMEAETVVLRFLDMAGSGRTQLTRIADGRVEYWPGLGYGRFGRKVTMAGAPRFGPDFQAARLLFADIDGSGATDLAYIHDDHIAVYLNQSGNSFRAEPLRVPLPAAWDPLHRIQFADVRGDGTNCLVFTRTHPEYEQWYYDFQRAYDAGPPADGIQGSRKPYLLRASNNNMGTRTEIAYASSTQFYLADKAAGRPWATTLPFPVNLVRSVTRHDDIARTSTTTAYSYHHGYYDGIEREFRGFGRVDRTDAATFADFHAAETGDDAAYHAPPAFTRTWYHTGAYKEAGELFDRFRAEYWNGDAQARELPGPDFEILEPNDPDVVRGAHQALHGAVLRTEVYGRDDSPYQDAPYTVSETRHHLQQIQLKAENPYAVFFLHERQTITRDYERYPHDPRISHECTLEVDEYGFPRRSVAVSYGRRAANIPVGLDSQTAAEQKKTWILYSEHDFIHRPENRPAAEDYLLGAPLATKVYEIEGATPDADGEFSCAGLKSQIDAALAATDTGPVAKLLAWERHYYYDAQADRELPAGEITFPALPHRTETAAFEKSALESPDEFGHLAPDDIRALLTGDGADFHGARGGYVLPADGDAGRYYWNPGASQSYDAANFYLPDAFYDAFQYEYVYHGAADRSGANRTEYTYDPHHLLVVAVTDPPGNESRVTRVDYRTLAPLETRDPNGNTQSVRLDPLGMVIVTSSRGTEAGVTRAFADLDDYLPADAANADDIMDDPGAYLQGAAAFFFYDLHAFRERGVPPHAVSLVYEDYTFLDGAPVADEPGVQKSIAYSDGYGRPLQTKTYLNDERTVRAYDGNAVVESTAGPCWITSGAVRYNDKGAPIERYEPCFSPDHRYIAVDALNQVGFAATLFYDASNREVLVRDPDGFISKTLFGTLDPGASPPVTNGFLNRKLYANLLHAFRPSPWSTLAYDANDALPDADYTAVPDADVDPDALAKAGLFAHTPLEQIEDGMGRVVESRQLNVADEARGGVFARFDILGREIAGADQRLHAAGLTNFSFRHGLAGEPIRVVSADAGTRWNLPDVTGQPLYAKDSRGFEHFHTYDVLNRPVTLFVQGGDGSQALNQIVRRIVYGDGRDANDQPLIADPAEVNLRGQALIQLDEAGLLLTPSFSITGQPLMDSRRLKREYKNEADWNQVSANDLELLAGFLYPIYRPDELALRSPPPAIADLLENESFLTSADFDALGRARRSVDADGNAHEPVYYSSGALKSVTVTPGDPAASTSPDAPAATAIHYNARGDRTSVAYANGIITTYTYDPRSLRLVAIRSRDAANKELQHLRYHHDPVGNVTSVSNDAVRPVFFDNQFVEPRANYTHDALYRLTSATGREHAGMWSNANANRNRLNDDLFQSMGPALSDGQALRNYRHDYTYDAAGNPLRMSRSGAPGRVSEIRPDSNRIATSTYGNGGPPTSVVAYEYDANGNMLSLDGTDGLTYNYRDNIRSCVVLSRADEENDAEYYVYDGAGTRLRKVCEQKTATGWTIEEVVYAGGIEVRRRIQRTNGSPGAVTREWHHARLNYGDTAFCDWRYHVTGDLPSGAKTNQQRYKLTDLLNSSVQEFDEDAQLITFEEYYPYGGTSITAAANQTEVKAKHYRYSGKEQDRSGLYFYGKRSYAPWLGRWTAADPAGTVDGLNLFAFVGGNPVTHVDVGGMMSGKKRKIDVGSSSSSTTEPTSTSKKQKAKAKKHGVTSDTTPVGEQAPIKRPGFSYLKQRTSQLEYELVTGKKASPKQEDLAAPHRLPYSLIRDVVLEKGEQIQNMYNDLSGASKEMEEVFRGIGTPLAEKVRRGYEKTRENLESAFGDHHDNQSYFNQLKLIRAFNNLAANAPGFGPHKTANLPVLNALHLNFSETLAANNEFALTPRSEAALTFTERLREEEWARERRDLKIPIGDDSADIVTTSGREVSFENVEGRVRQANTVNVKNDADRIVVGAYIKPSSRT